MPTQSPQQKSDNSGSGHACPLDFVLSAGTHAGKEIGKFAICIGDHVGGTVNFLGNEVGKGADLLEKRLRERQSLLVMRLEKVPTLLEKRLEERLTFLGMKLERVQTPSIILPEHLFHVCKPCHEPIRFLRIGSLISLNLEMGVKMGVRPDILISLAL